MAFDPYHKWLGIPPKDQPPNHYRLLGVELLESDLDVIENAADQRMRHVRSFQTGQHSAESQQLLNEIAQAKLVLLDPDEKSVYDQQFQAAEYQLEGAEAEAAPAFSAPTVTGTSRRRTRPKNPVTELIKIVAGGIAGTLIAFLLLSFLRADWDVLGIAKAVRTTFVPAPMIEVPPVPPGEEVVPPTPEEAPSPEKSIDVAPSELVPATTSKKKNKKQGSAVRPAESPDPPSQFQLINLPAIKSLPASRGAPAYEFARWDTGGAEQLLGPVDQCFMVTSLIGGYWLGNGEWFDLNIVDMDGAAHWRFQGGGVQGIAAGVTEIRHPLRDWFATDVEIKRWVKGDAPIQLIHKHDGFAVLIGANGCFLGSEEVKVHLAEDGYWYLSGKTVHDTRARAAIYRYKLPGKLRTIVTEHELKPKQSINKLRFEEAICSLSHITGRFQGFGEALTCKVQSDGTWYFACDALQPSTSGTVTSIVFDLPTMIELAESDAPAPLPPPATTDAAKQPAPDAAAIAAARTALGARLSGGYEELWKLAAETMAAERYVVLLAARDVAAAAGDCSGARKAVDTLAAGFEVDHFEVAFETLMLLRDGCTTPAAHRELAQLALAHFDTGVSLGKTSALRPLAELALAAGRAANDTDLQTRATLKLLELRK